MSIFTAALKLASIASFSHSIKFLPTMAPFKTATAKFPKGSFNAAASLLKLLINNAAFNYNINVCKPFLLITHLSLTDLVL